MQSVIFLSHGAPQIILDHSEVHDFLAGLGASLDGLRARPSAIVVISAHWESSGFRVTGSEQLRTIYDFGGFDPRLYEIIYPAKGNAALAQEIVELGHQAGLTIQIDAQRGLDHGAWVPLHLMYPEADIPVLQVSVPRGATPAEMFRLGQVLAPLREQNILILGSGSLTHNLYEFRGQDLDEVPPSWVSPFTDWFAEKVAMGDVASLLDYSRLAPFARENHPTAEHILPFFVVLGALNGQKLDRLHHSYNYGILAMDAYGSGLAPQA